MFQQKWHSKWKWYYVFCINGALYQTRCAESDGLILAHLLANPVEREVFLLQAAEIWYVGSE